MPVVQVTTRGTCRGTPCSAGHWPADRQLTARRLALLLRLAALLNRGRSGQPLPDLGLTEAGDVVQLRFPAAWLDAHPLTRADLDEERRYLKRAGFTLVSA